jgi:hypothetical protein
MFKKFAGFFRPDHDPPFARCSRVVHLLMIK